MVVDSSVLIAILLNETDAYDAFNLNIANVVLEAVTLP